MTDWVEIEPRPKNELESKTTFEYCDKTILCCHNIKIMNPFLNF